MCLMVFALRPGRRQPFVFASNRDEFHERPTRPAQFWERHPHVLAGRDERAGGTWCGCTTNGWFAALSNVRDLEAHPPRSDAPSRGVLVRRFLVEEPAPEVYLERVAEEAHAYDGFNLIVGRLDRLEIHYMSNRGRDPERLEPGVYGLSNHLLDTPWFKVRRTRRRFEELLEADTLEARRLLDVLAVREHAPEEELPDTGLDRERERLVSSPFIVSEDYGTRASTVVLTDRDGTIEFVERTYASDGSPDRTDRWRFELSDAGPPAAS